MRSKQESNASKPDPVKNAVKSKKREPFRLREIPEMLLLSAAVCFSLFILTPTCIFVHNQHEFPITYGRMISVMSISALADILTITLVLVIIRLISRGAYEKTALVIFGLLPASLVQAVLLNRSGTVFSGDLEKYNHINVLTVSEFVLFLAITLVPLVFTLVAKKRKWLERLCGKLVTFGSAAALGVQVIWFGIVLAGADLELKDTYTGYLSYKQSMSLSEDENIVVFISDRLDGTWMDQLLEEYPEMAEHFDGFTSYQNNISHSTNTFPSVIQMLTNKLYSGCEWPEFMREAWSGDTLPSVLKKEGGYNISLLPDCITTINNTRFLADRCDNVAFAEKDNIRYNYLGQYGIVHGMLKLSSARLSPYYFKGKAAKGLGANVGRCFLGFKEKPDDLRLPSMNPDTDMDFYNYLKKYGLSSDSENKTFSFVHLSGAHTSSREIAELSGPVDGKPDLIRTARGDFEIIFEYMRQLRELGLYDKTTVIIMGDHGRAPDDITTFHHTLEGPITTALLIKPRDSRGELAFDRYSELSNDNFAAGVLELAGIDHSVFGSSYYDIINNDLHPDRYLQTIQFNNYGRLMYHSLYKVTGDARDFANWEIMPEHENE